MADLPPLRPPAGLRGRPYFDALRALDAAHGASMVAEIAILKAQRGGKVTLAQIVGVCLRYRLTLFAGFTILEDRGALACGTYDMIRRGKRPGGGTWTVRDILSEVISRDGVPDAAPGCEAPCTPS